MRRIWIIAFISLFIMTACGKKIGIGKVTSFNQSVPVSGGIVQSFVTVKLADGTEVKAWLPQGSDLWRTLSERKAICIKIQRKRNIWRFVEILPARKFNTGEISLALLPLVDMSPEKDQTDLPSRIADEVLNRLSQEDVLRVASKESSFVFKAQDLKISEIKKQLNVSYVLVGSVLTSGERVKIVFELTNVNDNSIIWAEAFNVELPDVLTVRDKVVSTVVDAAKFDILTRESCIK